MSRSIEQTEIRSALTSLQAEIERVGAAVSEVEAYYLQAAKVDLDEHPQMGLEALTGFLQRMDALARTLRQDVLGSVERLWEVADGEMQTVHQRHLRLAAEADHGERERKENERLKRAEAVRAQELDEQQRVNRLLTDEGE